MARNNFDFIRLFLALLVIYAHSHPLLYGAKVHDPLKEVTGNDSGGHAVWGFFLISGMLIASSWLRRPQLGDFLRRRIYRIVPGFAVAVLICLACVVPLATDSLRDSYAPARLLKHLRNALTLTTVHDANCFLTSPFPKTVNGSLWTIQIEFLCYLLVPLLGWTRVLARRWLLLAAAVGLALVPSVGREFLLVQNFVTGTVFGLFLRELRFKGSVAALCLVGLGVAAWLGIYSRVFPFLGGYIVFWIAFNPSLKLQNFGKHGDFSYGTYLYAFPIQQLLVHYAGGALNVGTLTLCAGLLSLATGAASWYLVERKFMIRRNPRAGRPFHMAAPSTEQRAP